MPQFVRIHGGFCREDSRGEIDRILSIHTGAIGFLGWAVSGLSFCRGGGFVVWWRFRCLVLVFGLCSGQSGQSRQITHSLKPRKTSASRKYSRRSQTTPSS